MSEDCAIIAREDFELKLAQLLEIKAVLSRSFENVRDRILTQNCQIRFFRTSKFVKFMKNQGVKNFTLVARQDCCTLTVHGSHTLI